MSVYPKIESSLTILLGYWHTVLYFISAAARPGFVLVKLCDEMLLSMCFFQQQVLFPCKVEFLYEDLLVHIMNLFGFQ